MTSNLDWVGQISQYDVEEPDPRELPMCPWDDDMPPSELSDECLEKYYEECMEAAKREDQISKPVINF